MKIYLLFKYLQKLKQSTGKYSLEEYQSSFFFHRTQHATDSCCLKCLFKAVEYCMRL